MKAIKKTLGKELKELKIYTFSDWHLGDVFSDVNFINKQLETVKNDPQAYVILNGDLVNMATKTSVSDCYAEELSPMEQFNRLVTLLEPIKNKILMITTGNHESRTYKTDGIDLTYMVAKQLKIENCYCREGGVLFLRFGTGKAEHSDRLQHYIIYATHGGGGGRKEGAKAIRLADMASIVDADIYIHSHTHLPMIMKQAFYRTYSVTSSVAKVDKLFVNTAASLNYGGYGQTYEFKPASRDNPVIYLSGTRKEFTARL